MLFSTKLNQNYVPKKAKGTCKFKDVIMVVSLERNSSYLVCFPTWFWPFAELQFARYRGSSWAGRKEVTLLTSSLRHRTSSADRRKNDGCRKGFPHTGQLMEPACPEYARIADKYPPWWVALAGSCARAGKRSTEQWVPEHLWLPVSRPLAAPWAPEMVKKTLVEDLAFSLREGSSWLSRFKVVAFKGRVMMKWDRSTRYQEQY